MAAYYEEGRYVGKIVTQALGENAKGNPEFQLVCDILGCVRVDNSGVDTCVTYARTIYLTITDKTVDWILETLHHLGFKGESFQLLDPNKEGHHDFTGVVCDLLCKHSEYNGKISEKWSILRQGGAKTNVKPIEAKKVRGLDAKFAKKLKEKAKETVPTRTASDQPTNDTVNENDDNTIPF